MRIPPSVNIVLMVLGATAFYTMVGQMVPQKEVPAPEVIEISKDVSTEEMIEIGRGIAEGKGLCRTCHTIGQSGLLRFPDLEGIGARAATRIPGLSELEYLAQSLYEPDRYVVEGFNPGMPAMNKAPIGLTDDEIMTVIAYLQSLGGEPYVTMATKHAYNGGGDISVADAGPGDTGGTEEAPFQAGKALFESYQCMTCHSVAPPEPGAAITSLSLHDAGARLDRGTLFAGILDPEGTSEPPDAERQEKKLAMEAAGVFDKATVQEIQAIVDYLAALKGEE